MERSQENVLFIFLFSSGYATTRMVHQSTFSGAQSTVQAVQQALQMQQQMQMQQQGIQPYYSSMEYFLSDASRCTGWKLFSYYPIWNCIQSIKKKFY